MKVKFKNPENVGSFYSEDYISVRFWGVDFFKSFKGVEVEMGHEVMWKISRQISDEVAESIESVQSVVNTITASALMLIFLFVGLGGRLLPTWMFINSISLIVHTPLLAIDMPANLHYFFLKYLDILRLNSKSLNDEIDAQ